MSDVLDKLKRSLIDRYEIAEQLGEGGMATVFAADDLKHGRRVAIKVLRPEVAASIGSDRFLREIEIAARLQHPHIVPVYDSGDADGVLYYVMPLVEGDSLKERLENEGPLPWRLAKAITKEVASALDYAHRQGVVHRDIKPANILLSQGHAMVADFGIARAVSTSAAAGLTQAGMAIGTPWYMSPEQALGETEVDGRTDIYALGCVLCEMVTGKPPYDGPTPQSIIAKTISAPVPPFDQLPNETPKSAATTIARCLAKDPAERFQHANELITAIDSVADISPRDLGRRWAVPALAGVAGLLAGVVLLSRGGGSSPSSVVSGADVMAVLPFSVSGAGVEYLEEGMVDLLSTNLNAVGGIRTVDSRLVVSRWKKRGGEQGLEFEQSLDVGREVGAGSILTGSVVGTGPTVRFSAELHTVDGNEIGRVQMDGSVDSVLPLVDSLSLRILRAAWRSSEPLPSISVAGITSGSMDAIRAYLRGAKFYRDGQWDSALTAFTQAVEHDSTFALAHYYVASSHGWMQGIGSGPQRAAIDAAVRFADKLPSRDRSVVMAYAHFQRNEMAALDTMRAYVSRYPSDPVGWHLLGDVQFHFRPVLDLTTDEYLDPFDRALGLDSTFTPAVVHPTEIALAERNESLYRRYEPLVSRDLQQGVRLRQLAEFVFDDETDTAVLRELAGDNQSLGVTALAIAYFEPERRQTAQHLLDSLIGEIPANTGPWFQARVVQWMTALMTGKVQRARAFEQQVAELPVPQVQQLARVMKLQSVLAGLSPSADDIVADLESLADSDNSEQQQFAAIWLAQLALYAGDAPRAREWLRSFTPEPVTSQGFEFRVPALARAIGGWATLVEGDTTTGIREMRDALEEFGPLFASLQSGTGILRLQLAVAMASQPDTRADGIARLRYGFLADPELTPIAYLHAASALEASGDMTNAAALLSDVIDLWVDADAELQPRVETARRDLERVTAELSK